MRSLTGLAATPTDPEQRCGQAPKLWARLLEKVSVVLDEERKNEDTGEAGDQRRKVERRVRERERA